MLHKLRTKLLGFFESQKDVPAITAIAAGLYPIMHYYNNNLLMANSWIQIAWFVGCFIIIPSVVFKLVVLVSLKNKTLSTYKNHILTILNLFVFGVLLLNVTIGISKIYVLLIGVLAVILGYFLYQHLKKIIGIQLLLTLIAFTTLLPKLYRYANHSDDWLKVTDDITNAQFKTTPNIYIIQPDGYANFSELDKGHYGFDSTDFKQFLEANDFKTYENFRSNYYSTLTSNASMFAMKHHYFLNPKNKKDDYYDYREILAGQSTALETLRKNDYKTFLLLDYPYIVINRPTKAVDYINYSYSEMAFISNSWKGKEPLDALEDLMTEHKKSHNFFFIEKISPTHIENLKSDSKGVEGERLDYIRRIKESNVWLKQTIQTITSKDDNALIVLVSDHGGYVGLESAEDVYVKNDDPLISKSIFTSMLAIKWPNNEVPSFDDRLKTNVNLFRILFSHLSQNQGYLSALEDDKSYQIIDSGAPFGVYELIDDEYQVVFKRFDTP
jgi:hypothetical protein